MHLLNLIAVMKLITSLRTYKCAHNSWIAFVRPYIHLITAEFYLCRALQNVYDTTEEFKIMWLDAVDGTGDVYKKEYADTTEVTFLLS